MKIQVLKSTPVSGTSAKGAYSFHRLACIFIDDKGLPEAVGDVIHDTEVQPGVYPISFSVASYQGKLTAKIVLDTTKPAPSVAGR